MEHCIKNPYIKWPKYKLTQFLHKWRLKLRDDDPCDLPSSWCCLLEWAWHPLHDCPPQLMRNSVASKLRREMIKSKQYIENNNENIRERSPMRPILMPERAKARRADWAPGPGVLVLLPPVARSLMWRAVIPNSYKSRQGFVISAHNIITRPNVNYSKFFQ